MISVWVERIDETWFGVAHHADRLVATATGVSREEATRRVSSSLPSTASFESVPEGSAYARRMIQIMARLEAGEDCTSSFDLCPDCIGEPLASVAQVASRIPRGFVVTYGNIALAAGTDARVVGHIMATNPLYPIIPCHRVVGADFALVGYGGSRGRQALVAKLTRLRAEASGFNEPKIIHLPLCPAGLRVYPVEQVIEKAGTDGLGDRGQMSLW